MCGPTILVVHLASTDIFLEYYTYNSSLHVYIFFYLSYTDTIHVYIYMCVVILYIFTFLVCLKEVLASN